MTKDDVLRALEKMIHIYDGQTVSVGDNTYFVEDVIEDAISIIELKNRVKMTIDEL